MKNKSFNKSRLSLNNCSYALQKIVCLLGGGGGGGGCKWFGYGAVHVPYDDGYETFILY